MENESTEQNVPDSSTFAHDDVTMDNSSSFGYRSPSLSMPLTGNTSPGQVRTLREHNEILNALRKDNFNLKLRIYFLEEKNAEKTKADGTDSSLYKQNVDLKVETEALRQELKEKQELLCEAATAMELMEQEQKKCKDDSMALIDELQQKIQFLEMEVKELEKNNQDENGDGSMRRIKSELESQNKIVELEEYIRQYEIKTSEMSSKLTAAEIAIRQKDELLKNLEAKTQEMTEEIDELSKKLGKYEQHHSQVIEGLQTQICDMKIHMAEKECMVQMLEENVSEKTAAVDKGCKTIQYMVMKTKSLEHELARLKEDGKMENMVEIKKSDSSASSAEIADLKSQLAFALRESDETRQWLKECGEICTMLMGRLRELAEFLDSLLKQKGVLDVLAQDRRKAMRKAVDTSLNLSRSIGNISQRFSMNESNLQNLSALSDILNLGNDNKENIMSLSKSNSSHAMMDNLRAEVKGFRNEFERSGSSKKDRRNFSHLLDNNSESETWSEPDRRVSHARIGLEDTSKLLNNQPNSTSLSEDEDIKLSRKNSLSKLMERVQELEQNIAEKQQTILKIQCELVESDNNLKEERLKSNQIVNDLKRHQRLSEQLDLENSRLKSQSEMLAADLNTNKTESQKEIERIASDRDACGVDYRVATMKLSALQNDYDEMKKNHQSQIENLKIEAQTRMDKAISDLITKQKSELANVEVKYQMKLEDTIPQEQFQEQVKMYEDTRLRLLEARSTIENLKENEAELQAQMIENEKNMRTMKKSIDEATILTSKTVLERNKILSEKLTIEKMNSDLLSRLDDASLEKSELISKCAQLERANALLQNKLVSKDTQYQLTRSASQGNARYAIQSIRSAIDYSASGYTSDEFKPRLENSSPDLGIESDAGRTSGSDAFARLNKSDVLPSSVRSKFTSFAENKATAAITLSSSSITTKPVHDCERADREILELKSQLDRAHSDYKKILVQLQNSNERKVEIERDIRQEIWKTQNMLRSARVNIENVEKSTKGNAAFANNNNKQGNNNSDDS